MTETKINISELKSEGSDLIKELAQFIKEKTGSEVETTTSDIIAKGEGKQNSRTYLRVLLRKFLHQQGLKEYFRIIGGKDNALIVKEIKISAEED